MEIQEISEKYSIDIDLIRSVNGFLTFANSLNDGEYRPKDQTKEINKIVNAAPWINSIDDSSDFIPHYQEVLKTYHVKWPHPIEKISFTLNKGHEKSETVIISDEIVIEVIRQGLKNYLSKLPKTEQTAAHRPESKQRKFLKQAVSKLLKVAPDGSKNSKFNFVADVIIDLGYWKSEKNFDDKYYTSHNEYKLSKVKNALK